jgi:hypothetical protein
MPRPRARACLQDGLKLDLNRLYRHGFIQRGARSGPVGIRWYSTYWDKEIASGLITANVSGVEEGWLRLQLGNLDEWIPLVAHPRHFGGRQWYFMCPAINRPVSVLWRPPGARTFRSRQAWGRQVAYRSQFSDADNRAHLGKERIKARLIADLDPDEWDLPPKPKWMRGRRLCGANVRECAAGKITANLGAQRKKPRAANTGARAERRGRSTAQLR